jgi:para-aminobenzoate synthetase component 1
MMLHTARPHQVWGRWTIAASPQVVYRFDGRSNWIGAAPPELQGLEMVHDFQQDLDTILAATRIDANRTQLPFIGGWIGYLAYDLGRTIEPAVAQAPVPQDDRGWPLIELAYCPDALVYDHASGAWWVVGNGDRINLACSPSTAAPEIGPLESAVPPQAHIDAVRRTIGYIAAGDIYQANITQRLTARFQGSTRCWSHAALQRSGAWFGAHLELPDERCLVSLSPELFLAIEPAGRRIITRPIKGTRPSEVDRRELAESAKDAAELHMIVDLLRNDLGRVCDYGTVRVNHARRIETHPTVHHGVGEIQGRLRDDVSIGQLLSAVFPGGSVTGVPKIRAMQVIDELEPVRRGPYCGAIGYLGDDGAASLNVAIRTAAFSPDGRGGAWLDYGVGGGIVADSDPVAEYEECMTKARVLGFNQPSSEAAPVAASRCTDRSDPPRTVGARG